MKKSVGRCIDEDIDKIKEIVANREFGEGVGITIWMFTRYLIALHKKNLTIKEFEDFKKDFLYCVHCELNENEKILLEAWSKIDGEKINAK